jgi:glycosyltransferase involved in cell wall biosynthesis
MVPYKKISLIVQAFRELPDRRLIVVGEGPEFGRIKEIAAGAPNIEIQGYQPSETLRNLMQRARAFVFAAKEDFGIIAVEAQAAGTPVIAYGRGGALETVIPLGSEKPTGVFFYEQTTPAIHMAIATFEQNENQFSPDHCRENSMRFSDQIFRERFQAFVEECMHRMRLAVTKS